MQLLLSALLRDERQWDLDVSLLIWASWFCFIAQSYVFVYALTKCAVFKICKYTIASFFF